VGQLAGRAFDYIKDHPKDVAKRFWSFASSHKNFIAGRLVTGSAVTAGGGGSFGAGMTTLATAGSGIKALNNVVSQLESGKISTNSLSNPTLGGIVAAGSMGASVNFNAKTGNITATISSQTTGSIIQTRSAVLCNVNKGGC
jgi:hypothetical protein